MTRTMPDPLLKLKEDHQRVERLFRQFERADMRSRHRIVEQVLAMLERHSNIEEDLVYPAIREAVGDDHLVDKAVEEHHLMSLLARELRQMQPRDEGYAAKFEVLSDVVRRHVEDEEDRMFPEALEADIDWDHIGKQQARRSFPQRQERSRRRKAV